MLNMKAEKGSITYILEIESNFGMKNWKELLRKIKYAEKTELSNIILSLKNSEDEKEEFSDIVKGLISYLHNKGYPITTMITGKVNRTILPILSLSEKIIYNPNINSDEINDSIYNFHFEKGLTIIGMSPEDYIILNEDAMNINVLEIKKMKVQRRNYSSSYSIAI